MWSDLLFFIFYMIPNKKILSRTIKKPESVGEKMVESVGKSETHISFLGLTHFHIQSNINIRPFNTLSPLEMCVQ